MQFYTFRQAMGYGDVNDPFEAYHAFLNSSHLPETVYHFATTVSLNDAYVERVIFDKTAKTLSLFLLTGDLQVGYWRTEIRYTHAGIHGSGVLKTALTRRPSEVWYDEFGFREGMLCHSFLLVPQNFQKARAKEFHISFEGFSFDQSPVQDRALSTVQNISRWK